MRWLVQRICRGDERCILTNFAVELDGLRVHVAKEKPDLRVEWEKRLKVLTPGETKEFYRHRGFVRGRWLVLPAMEEDQMFEYDVAKHGGPVIYLLDELHIHFNAKRWKAVPRQLNDYITQHGKCGDTVVWVSQLPRQVVNDLRDLAEDYTEFHNLTHRPLFGMWKQPRLIEWSKYSEVPGPMSVAEKSGKFPIRPDGIGRTYRTAAGVGIEGDLADTQEVAVGLPFWSVFVAIAVAVWVLWQVPKVLAMGATKLMGAASVMRVTPAPGAGEPEARPDREAQWRGLPQAETAALPPLPVVKRSPVETVSRVAVVPQVRRLNGVVAEGGKRFVYYCEDGGSINSWGPDVVVFGPDFVGLKDGRMYRF
jgi:hypothetical protein